MCDPVLTRYKGRAAEGLPGKVLPTGLRASCLQGPWGPDAEEVTLTCTPGRRAEKVTEPPAWSREVTPPGPQTLGYGVERASAGLGTDVDQGSVSHGPKHHLGVLTDHLLFKPGSRSRQSWQGPILSPGDGIIHLATPSSQTLLLPIVASGYPNYSALVTNTGCTMIMSPLVFPNHSQQVFLYDPLTPREKTPEFLQKELNF